MATNTYVALDKVTVTTATPSITFTGINGNYTDLIVVASLTAVTASANLLLTFNGDTTSGLYSKTQLEGTGSSALSGRTTGANSIGLDSNIGDDASAPSIHILQLMNYANTSVFKTVLHRQSGFWSANPGVSARVGIWRNTNAITSITLNNGGTNLAVGSTFSLYGIANANIVAKATGGTITYDNTYFYHTFAASGTFTPKQSLSCDVLVVAGGGGGGSTGVGGGGGAGGLLGFASQSLTTTSYNVTVGAGGAVNTLGVDSQFGALTLVKGGGYGVGGGTGATGGSGGGGGISSGAGGSPTSSQGNAGGAGFSSSTGTTRGAGGGGGAGAVGADGTSGTGGTGGIGSTTYSSWGVVTNVGQNVSGTYYLAGGGGGGSSSGYGTFAGGNGGGGAGTGSGTVNATAAIANTGGGGGGGGTTSGVANSTGAAGGSGVVIVRYRK